MHLNSIRSHVDVAGIRIAVDDGVAGADVAPAVTLVGTNGRELQQIDLVVAHYILHDRAGLYLFGWHTLCILNPSRGLADKLHGFQVSRQAKRQRSAHPRGDRQAENAKAFGISFDLVEHQRWGCWNKFRGGFSQRAEFKRPVGAENRPNFAKFLALAEKRAQSVIFACHPVTLPFWRRRMETLA